MNPLAECEPRTALFAPCRPCIGFHAPRHPLTTEFAAPGIRLPRGNGGNGGNRGRTGEGRHGELDTDAPGGGGGDGHPHDDRGGRTGGDGDGDNGKGKRERWWPGRKPLIIVGAVVFVLVTAGLAWWLATRGQASAEYANTGGNALAVYRTDQTRAAALDDAVKAEQGALELARDRYRKGLSPFIDVLDAEQQWSEGQQAVQGALQTTTDLVALCNALGGGWQTAGAAAGAATVGATPPPQGETTRAR